MKARRGRVSDGGHQGSRRNAHRRHHHHSTNAPPSEPLAGIQADEANGVQLVSIRRMPLNTRGLRDALEKLRLNDSSFTFEPETSQALGFGFRCGFLGLLHMDIIRERLEREFGLSLITTAATVVYRVITTNGESLAYR